MKTQLINDGNWKTEVERRLQMPQHQDKCVEVILKRRKNAISLQVIDQGPGFAWNKYLKLDPARAQDNHGRGIAMANGFCFDEISYNEQGNTVTALCRLDEELQW
jgi:anti-sigma regulatory factor (Ser/Thr protein kinase)